MSQAASLTSFERRSGVLLHPTSLPGKFGIGDFGEEAYQWIDFLSQSGCSLWQVLPLGQTGFGDSPYQCLSSFAGNPNLISPASLVREGLLSDADLSSHPPFPQERVDFPLVIPWKQNMLHRAYQTYQSGNFPHLEAEFREFCRAHSGWLEPYAQFIALKSAHQGSAWMDWETPFRLRQREAMHQFTELNREIINEIKFQQFLFFRQWQALRTYAAQKGIAVIGDLPIFVAQDSCEVWANPELFKLYPDGHPRVVAGVPPDYFSPTGQRWGNPLYNWQEHKNSDFSWWVNRIMFSLRLFDFLRLDHFRGFCACWEVPAQYKTAERGRWVKTPGSQIFTRLLKEYTGQPSLPIIAEDLGVITDDVIALRERFNLPGMKILQFAFGDKNPKNPFLPHNFRPHCVVYTGTHDNDTSAGWYASLSDEERSYLAEYLPGVYLNPGWELIRYAWASVAKFAIAPLQDLLNLGSEARMNFPGTSGQNWQWRMTTRFEDLPQEPLYRLNRLYNRIFPTEAK